MQKDKQERYLELLAGLRLMDDDFFSEALDEKIAPVEYILNPLLAQEVRYLKETEGGRTQMCRAFEEIAFESAKEATHKANVAVAQKMLADGGLTLEQIAKFSSLPLSEVQELADKMPA